MKEEARGRRLFRTALKVDFIYIGVIAVIGALVWLIL